MPQDEERPNRKDLCGFYFVPYETLETIEATLGATSAPPPPPQPLVSVASSSSATSASTSSAGGVWVSDFDVAWAPESYLANQHLPSARGKDYRLLQADMHTMQPANFSGPLPHLVAPWPA